MLTLQIDYRIGGAPRYYFGDAELLFVPDEVRKCVAFLAYQTSDGPKLAGTVFFVSVGYPEFDKLGGGGFTYAVTAKHVIESIRKRSIDGKVYVRMNFKNAPASVVKCNIADWRFHPLDTSVDVAVLPISFSEKFDHLAYPTSSFATEEVIQKQKIGLGEEVFLVGLFYGHVGKERNIPIIRVGNIAAMPEEPVHTDIGAIDAYLIEARSIGGLSGSPVFVYLGFMRPHEGGVGIGGGGFYLLGVMHGHWDRPVSDADTMVVDDVHHETVNMGIAVVVPAKKILEVLHQPEFEERMQKQLEEVRKKSVPTPDSR